MPHVEQEVNVVRAAMLVAEAVDLHAHRRAVESGAEALDEKSAQRVNRVLGSVNDLVGVLAYVRHRGALASYGFEESGACVRRVRSSRLAEAAHERLVRRLEEEDEDAKARRAQLAESRGELAQESALSDVDDERGAFDVRAVVVFGADEARKRRQERERQVVDAEVAEVFERVRGRRHAGTAQARDD